MEGTHEIETVREKFKVVSAFKNDDESLNVSAVHVNNGPLKPGEVPTIGTIEMQLTKEDTRQSFFKAGQEYYVDFTKVEEEQNAAVKADAGEGAE
jgi:hypothetical protein